MQIQYSLYFHNEAVRHNGWVSFPNLDKLFKSYMKFCDCQWRPCYTSLQSLSAVSSLRLWWKRPLRRFGLSTRDWTTSSSRAVCCLRASHAPSWIADVSVSWTIGAWRLLTGQGPHPGPVVDTAPSWTQTVTTMRQWLGPRPSRSRVSICGQHSIPTPVQPGKSLESNIQFVTSQIQNPIHCLCHASCFCRKCEPKQWSWMKQRSRNGKSRILCRTRRMQIDVYCDLLQTLQRDSPMSPYSQRVGP